jgi:hypothetical protein
MPQRHRPIGLAMETRTGGAVLSSDEGYGANRVGSLPAPEVAEFQQHQGARCGSPVSRAESTA